MGCFQIDSNFLKSKEDRSCGKRETSLIMLDAWNNIEKVEGFDFRVKIKTVLGVKVNGDSKEV